MTYPGLHAGDSHRSSRREWLASSAAQVAAFASCTSRTAGQLRAGDNTESVLTARGVGDVKTPLFYRHDIGNAPGRMHEPTAGPDGNIWTSPLDGKLWQYNSRSGETTIHDLQKLTGQAWAGIHLWPVAAGPFVYLCTPSRPKLSVWNRELNRITTHDFPHAQPAVYGGFVEAAWPPIYFYDTRHASVVKWNPESQTGENFPCPYKLSGTLYMSFTDVTRNEIWGSTYTGNDIVRFDVSKDTWTAHYKCPNEKATPTAGGKVFGKTLWVSDHLHGRLFPLNVDTGFWGEPIPIPGYREWFGYVSGGWLFREKLYMCHSTWIGGTDSLDGEPHHFLGSWTVFDPKTREFSRLDIPTRPGENRNDLMSDYAAKVGDDLFLLAVDRKPARTVIVLQTKPV